MRKEKIFSLRLTSGMREALGVAAKRDRRSVASLLEKIIADYLAREGLNWEKSVSFQDRRLHPRKSVSLPARLIIQHPPDIYEETEALIENMSLGGTYVSYTNGHRSHWKLHSDIHLSARIPQLAVPLELVCRAVRVIREEQKVGVGLRYLETPGETLAQIEQFLQVEPTGGIKPPNSAMN
jgi:hypothetical protein